MLLHYFLYHVPFMSYACWKHGFSLLFLLQEYFLVSLSNKERQVNLAVMLQLYHPTSPLHCV